MTGKPKPAMTAVITFLLLLFGTGPFKLAAEVEQRLSYDYFPAPYVDGVPVSVGSSSSRIGIENTSLRQSSGLCRVERLRIVSPCKITLPKLEVGDAATRAKFEAEVAETLDHEMAYCNIALAHARILESRVLNLVKNTCDELKEQIKKEFDSVDAECVRNQRLFGLKRHNFKVLEQGAEQQGNNFKVLEPGVEQLSKDGFYKDKNGVWRNH